MKRLAIHSYSGEVALAMVLMTAAMVVVLWVADAVGQTSAAGSEAYLEALVPLIPLANALREARRRRGWTQLDLAARLESARATVSRWEHGKSLPRYRHLQALTPLLHLTPGEFRRPERSARRPASPRLGSVAERIARALAELAGRHVSAEGGHDLRREPVEQGTRVARQKHRRHPEHVDARLL